MRLFGTDCKAVAAVACLALLGVIGRPVEANPAREYSDSEIRNMLQKIASDMNRSLPKMLDAEIRLDSVEAGYREIRYNNTLVHYTAAQIDRNVIIKKTFRRLKESFCKGETRQLYLEHKIRTSYIYRGNDGKEIARLKIDPAQC